MAKFLTGNELNAELEKLFDRADEQLILISPYIKLHDRYASTLRTKKDNPKVKIIIVFGKNEEDLSRSMMQDDFNFFKDFLNIEIRYEKRLHAKYYANEFSAILTSMNLYNFSQDNNIEAGVLTKATSLSSLASNLVNSVIGEDTFEGAALAYFSRVIEQSELLFKKEPEYESQMLGFTKKFKSSHIVVDKLTDFFVNRTKFENNKRESIGFKTTKNVPTFNPVAIEEPKVEIAVPKDQGKSDTKYVSVSAFSRDFSISTKEINAKLEKNNCIEKRNEETILTDEGIRMGAIIKNGQHGEYIAWPLSVIKQIVYSN
jgi:hypothetical protein